MRGKVKWEGMWVIFVECVAYSAALVSPDADFVSIRLTNGSPHRRTQPPYPSTPAAPPSRLPPGRHPLISSLYRALPSRHVGRVDALRGLDPNVPRAAHDPGECPPRTLGFGTQG